jgi:maltose alpha-D-glucosyltransferase/alpha-amylase
MPSTPNKPAAKPIDPNARSQPQSRSRALSSTTATPQPQAQSQWYKDAIIYELHVRSFFDSSADGVGDFAGLTQKLDYLQDLGVTAVWLLPFYASPLQDDGYDIADYTAMHPAYGSLRDFKLFLREAHNRGLRVITELVLNHTSDRHPWFERARHARPGSALRNFYVWSDTPERYGDARIIFKDFEASNWTWDPVSQSYYWHRFYANQPDLNYDNPEVRKAMLKVVDFWFKMGIDGLRLDAVPYLYEREGTTGENLSETHNFLKELRAYVDRRYPDKMLLAEANQWPEEAVAYFGEGDECHMAFHFPLMPRLFMAIRREDSFPIVDIMTQTPLIPDNAQWALFLRNHDELTLEMVTDEERLYMYRVYAHDPEARVNLGIRRRLAPLLHNDRRRIELMNALLFSLPGTPVIYYGDEIGMGDNIYLGDRNGVRTPMQWNADRNAGFSRANPQQLFLPLITDHDYHYESLHVEAQENNPHSLLAWMRRLIALRKRYQAFGRGSLEFLRTDNRKVLAFVRTFEEERILVVANLSRFVQHADLDLSAFNGMVPVEVFGRVAFPTIGEQPYFLTLGPHTFYWFSLQPEPVESHEAERDTIPSLATLDGWQTIIRDRSKHALEEILPEYLCTCHWFRGARHRVLAARVGETIPVQMGRRAAHIGLVRVDYSGHDPELYVLPMAFAHGPQAEALLEHRPGAVIARLSQKVQGQHQVGVLYDAAYDPDFAVALLNLIARKHRVQGTHGVLTGEPRPALRGVRTTAQADAKPTIVEGDLNNTSIVFGDSLILKLFRCIDEGVNPDVEIGDFLTERRFKHTPPIAGALEYRPSRRHDMTVAVVERYVPHQGHASDLAAQALSDFCERVLASRAEAPRTEFSTASLLALAAREPADSARELIGPFLDQASLLGKRTAELHLALSAGADKPDFQPQPFTPYYQRSLYQGLRRLTGEAMYTLTRNLNTLPEDAQQEAQMLLASEGAIMEHFRHIYTQKIEAMRTRCHGDYRLDQVLYAEGDFVFIDFEGESGRLMPERRLKRSPLIDVAAMIRSLHYAAHLAHLRVSGPGEAEAAPAAERLAGWTAYWVQQTAAAFLGEYLRTAAGAPFVPPSEKQLFILLDSFLLENMLKELDRDLRNRLESARIPLHDLLTLVQPFSEPQKPGDARP